jgi:Cu(I)/Ag(I) efflux system membrane fusion protein/cobalt-zinc-cadmium efflux system membrane fusion protein
MMKKTTKRARVLTAAVAVLGILAGGIVAFYKVPAFHALLHPHPVGANAARTAEQYTCGMHPFILSDKPGNCPICGMALTKIEGAPPPGGTAGAPAPLAAKPSGGARVILF